MPYVAKDDIIAHVETELNVIQGSAQTYDILLYKDFIGNALNLNEPTSFHVAVYSDNNKVLQYSNPNSYGVSDVLNIDNANNTGKIDFEITSQQSTNIQSGRLFAEISVIYENYYPQPKTYVFARIEIGNMIHNPAIVSVSSTETGSGTGSTTISHNGKFTIEHINGLNPSLPGYASVNSGTPGLVDSIVFRNLDSNNTRLTSLENFLNKRISSDAINGVITLIDTASTNMYAIYKIDSWERIDITPGNGDADDSDGIKINVSLEAASTGPGVTKVLWEVGQKITFELDAHGITRSSIMPTGILTYVDKKINPTLTSGDHASTGISITHSPYQDSYVTIEVNGISVALGDGNKDTDSYFSGDSGITPASIEEVRAGDTLYWNGSIAGFDLEAGDAINLIYEANSEDLI